jgi:DNA-binding response OmpR family regulator
MLSGLRVLVVEDEALVAATLADVLHEAGAMVAGPVRGNREAAALLDEGAVDLALLDINVADGDITPTAERCLLAGTPILICTGGVLPRSIRLLRLDLPVHRKPISPARLVRELASLAGRSKAA